MRSKTGLPKLPELAEHLIRGLVDTHKLDSGREAPGSLEGVVCLDSIDNGVSEGRSTWDKVHGRPALEQCEICDRWSRDVAYVPEICGEAVGGNLVCGHCEREAVAKFEGALQEIFPGAKVLL